VPFFWLIKTGIHPMPKLDIYHHTVKRALEKDNWIITHDQFTLQIGKKRLFADLGAKYLVGAEKGEKKIVVEVKSFIGKSEIDDLEKAVGQYVIYQQVINKNEPDYILYLAVTTKAFNNIFEVEIGQLLLDNQIVRLIVFNPFLEEITKWIPN
jgi:hypothetical protein